MFRKGFEGCGGVCQAQGGESTAKAKLGTSKKLITSSSKSLSRYKHCARLPVAKHKSFGVRALPKCTLLSEGCE